MAVTQVDAQPAKKPRVGVVFNAVPMSQLPSAVPSNSGALAFQEELAKAGWQSGKNVEILWRSAESDFTRFPSVIEEMLRHEVAVIVVGHNEDLPWGEVMSPPGSKGSRMGDLTSPRRHRAPVPHRTSGRD